MKRLPLFLLLIPFLSGCVGLGTFQTAKTLGKGKAEVHLGTGISFDDYWPAAGFGYKHGIRRNLDVGFTATYVLDGYLLLLVDGKYQFLGDSVSLFAVSSGLGVGRVHPSLKVWKTSRSKSATTFHLPVYLSIHPCKYFAFYASPRYAFSAGSIFRTQPKSPHLFVVTGGIKIGNRAGFFIERTSVVGRQNLLHYQHALQLGLSLAF